MAAIGDHLATTIAAGTARLRSTPGSEGGVMTWDGVADLGARIAWLSGTHGGMDVPDLSRVGASALRDALGDTAASGFSRMLEGLAALSDVPSRPMRVVRAGGRCYFNIHDDGTVWEPRGDGVCKPLARGQWKASRPFDGPAEDPLWLLDALTVVREPASSRDDAIDGEPATRYSLIADVIEADRRSPEPIRVADVEVRSLTALPADVWVDAAGRIRRMHATWAAGPGRVTELYDFGVDVEMTAPANLPTA